MKYMNIKTEGSNINFVQKHPNAVIIPILSKKLKALILIINSLLLKS